MAFMGKWAVAGALAGSLVAGLPFGVLAQSDKSPDEITQEQNARTYWRGDALTAPPESAFNMPSRPQEDRTANTMVEETLSAEAKMRMMQSMMAFNPFSLRDMISFMVVKKKVLEGISFDEVVESLQLKANQLNMRGVGHNTPYTILREIHDPDSPRLEIFGFCDLITMRMILDYSLEFLAFLPCRIAVVEDANQDIWLVSLDWDVRWLDTSPNPNKIPAELRERAISVRERIETIMEAAANGDL
jgi:uncharacterized protein (DUF302 family)